jgi:hypothetical protein
MTDAAVSWKLIEPGWEVRSSAGTPIGHVFKVVGDSDDDIFDGLAIVHKRDFGYTGLHSYWDRPRYVSQEHVTGIDEGVVTLDLSTEQVNELPLHDVPESAEILPETASRGERLGTKAEHLLGDDKTF